MSDQDECGALRAVHLQQQFDDLRASGGVQVAGGFIREQYLGSGDEGACDGHTLLFAAGKVFGQMTEALMQADAVQGLRGACARISRTVQFQRQHHVLQRGERRQQLEGLEHEASQATAQARTAILIKGEQVFVIQTHCATARHIQPRKQPEQRGFARTRCAQDSKTRTRLDAETDVLQDVQRHAAAFYLLTKIDCLHNACHENF